MGGDHDAIPVLETVTQHTALTDMPDTGGTNGDHDERYLKLNQGGTPQTVSNGAPIFNAGLKSNGAIILKAGQKLIFDGE